MEFNPYSDLQGDSDLGLLIQKLQARNKQLEDHIVSLELDISKLCSKLTDMKHTQENLTRNISELFKTAKSEMERKDRKIVDLQLRLDDILFKRSQRAPIPVPMKHDRENSPADYDSKRQLPVQMKHNRENSLSDYDTKRSLPAQMKRNRENSPDYDSKRNRYDKQRPRNDQFNSGPRSRSRSGERRNFRNHKQNEWGRGNRDRSFPRRDSRDRARNEYKNTSKIEPPTNNRKKEQTISSSVDSLDYKSEDLEEGEITSEEIRQTCVRLERKRMELKAEIASNQSDETLYQQNSNIVQERIEVKTSNSEFDVTKYIENQKQRQQKMFSKVNQEAGNSKVEEDSKETETNHGLRGRSFNNRIRKLHGLDKAKRNVEEQLAKVKIHKNNDNLYVDLEIDEAIQKLNVERKNSPKSMGKIKILEDIHIKEDPNSIIGKVIRVNDEISTSEENSCKELRHLKLKTENPKVEVQSEVKTEKKEWSKNVSIPEANISKVEVQAEKYIPKIPDTIKNESRKRDGFNTAKNKSHKAKEINPVCNKSQKRNESNKMSNESQKTNKMDTVTKDFHKSSEINAVNDDSQIVEGTDVKAISNHDFNKSKESCLFEKPIKRRELEKERKTTTAKISSLLEKPIKQRELDKETKSITAKISSLFDTPIKQRPLDKETNPVVGVMASTEKLIPKAVETEKANFDLPSFHLTHDGGIPELHIKSSDFHSNAPEKTTVEILETSVSNSMINCETTPTPVTEFQIFKSNLPVTEKSNSSTGAELICKENSRSKEGIISDRVAINQIQADVSVLKTSVGPTNNDMPDGKNQFPIELCTNKKISVPSAIPSNILPVTSDLCNLSYELLQNNEVKEFSAENYPNLTAMTSELNKSHDSLPSSLNSSANILNETTSPNNARKKRRRCVISFKD